ncbi:MAG: hypothetical protein HY785_29130 [Oscillatoriophycideae cyanobacterium NC_groundwater_1537_Pr4_S-0.65um_50_18]|nr:hypothetical protein [Oscillatoriophycideae cyanobacterium NC_groundwater_1537_Pr4_S-0.65um_50_18]
MQPTSHETYTLPSPSLSDAYGSCHLWTANSSEWTSVMQKEALDTAQSSLEAAKPATLSATTVGIVAGLLSISFAALTWGAVHLTQSAVSFTQTTGQQSLLSDR